MIEQGCKIEGEVSDSTVLEGAEISAGAVVHGCLVGKGASIGANAYLENVIIDHHAVIPSGYKQTQGSFY